MAVGEKRANPLCSLCGLTEASRNLNFIKTLYGRGENGTDHDTHNLARIITSRYICHPDTASIAEVLVVQLSSAWTLGGVLFCRPLPSGGGGTLLSLLLPMLLSGIHGCSWWT
jgi:hypothetical protein